MCVCLLKCPQCLKPPVVLLYIRCLTYHVSVTAVLRVNHHPMYMCSSPFPLTDRIEGELRCCLATDGPHSHIAHLQVTYRVDTFCK